MKKLILNILFLASAALPARGEDVDFHRDVAPILREYCAGCHNDDELKGELSLETWKLLMKGGEDGPSIKPGDAAGSRLIELLSGKKKPYMPPRKKAQPSAAHIETLRAWINAGAKGPEKDVSILSTLNVPEVAAAENVEKPITALAFSPTGARAVARFTSVKVGKQTLTGHPGKINAISFSKDGRQVVTATGVTGLGGEAFLWDVETGKLIRRFTGEHRDILFDAELSPDGSILATAGYDRSIKVWETGSGKLLRTIEGHNGAIYDIAFSPDGSVLASAGGDASVKLWQVSTGLRLDTLGQPTGEQFNVADTAFSPVTGFDHRLQDFQSMEIVGFNPSAVDRNRFFDVRTGRQFQVRASVSQRDRAACHQGDLVLAGRFKHLLGPISAVREMLVIKEGDKTSGAFHDSDGLVKEFLAGVHLLSPFIERIIPMLSDRQHGIDGQFLAAQAKCLVDRLKQRNFEALRDLSCHVIVRKLVGIKRDHVHTGIG